MTFFEALLLGIVQGLTEFFPISSSAHLSLIKGYFGLSTNPYVDLVAHVGTLAALIPFLSKEILAVLKSKRQIALFSLSLFPLVPVYFFLKPYLAYFSAPRFLPYTLLITSLLLLAASLTKKEGPKKNSHAFWIGCMQCLALIPGISRSGATIALSRFLGWNLVDGAKFSFLLSIPAILGGFLLETIKLPAQSIEIAPLFVAFLSAFLIGTLTIRLVFLAYEKKKIIFFAAYCALISSVAFSLIG